ncbi:tRNA (adenosine(37)-N6)-threonylcarbamoyltransferase complex dimerization subunit type 1 TsaB [Actinoplanes sp. TBRC 11911]|uniref:tRNA (adenosine(37)-N6)-threonylcarbamoyltransferase complex dimerization subunit type 1 TsaB n=1 Tax=Actinoplanes sp. TBRC 11911 TaxID=2729386 RepID=UPI00145E8BAE|nr:tRNA (adenosine(37)-N6)-threonylcarbamoyltransferase complex dimerization subunit type 1 TsaB [Actinoplanes sp. TBRC 11911]NMO56467.1 tRNA (adenosine(37)-N6)-threonylcarbamoyltransferase complex dimerization subunit type 1 TsaB [Actinoplanes sp. TBRC 11911]
MLVLALDTATPASSVALVKVTSDWMEGVVERRAVDPRAHGETLAPEIAEVLAEAGVGAGDLGAIVAGTGPGPFTGLRVGLATAASMGQALGIPTYGVCSLDALGRAAGPGLVLVATDARRREVYFATYEDGVRTFGPEVARPADVASIIAARTRRPEVVGESEIIEAATALAGAEGAREAAAIARAEATSRLRPDETLSHEKGKLHRGAGEGVLKYGEIFRLPVEEHLLYPPPAALVALAADRIRAGEPGEQLTPLYLRRPDAVEPAARKPVLT